MFPEKEQEEIINEFVNVIKMKTNINETVRVGVANISLQKKILICITCQYPKVLLKQYANSITKNARHVQH